MALHWDVSKVLDRLEKYPPTEDSMNGVTYALIMLTMPMGMGQITEQNAAEFYARVHFYEKLAGPMLRDGQGNDVYITAANVRDHVGLSTNVGLESRAAWLKRMGPRFMDEFAADFKREEVPADA